VEGPSAAGPHDCRTGAPELKYGAAAITFSRVQFSLPTAGAEPPLLAPRRTCISHRRMPKTVRKSRATLNGKRRTESVAGCARRSSPVDT
jgi:hypothetical protein